LIGSKCSKAEGLFVFTFAANEGLFVFTIAAMKPTIKIIILFEYLFISHTLKNE